MLFLPSNNHGSAAHFEVFHLMTRILDATSSLCVPLPPGESWLFGCWVVIKLFLTWSLESSALDFKMAPVGPQLTLVEDSLRVGLCWPDLPQLLILPSLPLGGGCIQFLCACLAELAPMVPLQEACSCAFSCFPLWRNLRVNTREGEVWLGIKDQAGP